jgi:hypothetical protein
MRCSSIFVVVALLTSAGSALAQSSSPAAPVAIPDLSASEKDLGDERKYWVLHKPGVSIEQATRDLTFCWQYVPHGVQRSVPGFVPFRQADANRPVTYNGGNYGLVGAVIASMIAGPLERSIRQSRMFRCMVPRGYHRYRITEDRWKEIYQADPQTAIPMLAAIAAGPVPPNPRVLP